MRGSVRVAAASVSFSKDVRLRRELRRRFPRATFNETGRRLDGSELARFLAGADAAIVGLETVDDALLAACPALSAVAKYGVGLDSVDQEACRRRGVAVRWSGGVNRRSVAELALGFMIALCRNVWPASRALREGRWNKDGGVELGGRTVGIIGVGHVGKELISLLKPFGCRLLVNDIIEQKGYYARHDCVEASKTRIFRTADIVTLHVPLTPRTRRLVGARELGAMKKTSFLVNTARGPVVDQAALKRALERGAIAGAAVDVYEEEPPRDRALLGLPNLLCTPHIGGNSREAIFAMGMSAVEHLSAFFARKRQP